MTVARFRAVVEFYPSLPGLPGMHAINGRVFRWKWLAKVDAFLYVMSANLYYPWWPLVRVERVFP